MINDSFFTFDSDKISAAYNLRPRIDDRDAAVAHDIGAGAVEGERAGITRDDPADHRGDGRHHAIFEFELRAKRDRHLRPHLVGQVDEVFRDQVPFVFGPQIGGWSGGL